MRGALPLSLVAAALTGAGLAPAVAQADCCMGPAMNVWLPLNTPLGATVHPLVANDDPDHPAVGTVRVLLNVGDRRIADLGTVTTTATTSPRELAIRVGSKVLRRARAASRRRGAPARRGVLKFVVRAADPRTGHVFPAYATEAFVTLTPPRRATGPTVIPLDAPGVRGLVRVTTPRMWRRTSPARTSPATFLPPAPGAGCRPHVTAIPVAVASNVLDSSLTERGFRREVLSEGRSPGRRWLVTATAPTSVVTATAYRRISSTRFAGAEVSATFSPGCTESVRRSPSLVRALRDAARGATVRLALSAGAR